MSNKYGSRIKRFWSSEISTTVEVLAPPADTQYPALGFTSQIVSWDSREINDQSNIKVVGAGLFCNFADGLVFKDFSQRLPLFVTFKAFTLGTALLGTTSITAGTKGLVGSAAARYITEGLAQNDYVQTADGQTFKLSAAPSTEQAVNIYGYPVRTVTTQAMSKLTPSANAQTSRFIEIGPVLNTMFPVENFINPVEYSETVINTVILEVSLLNNTAIDFLTKSISTSYAGEDIHLSVALDVEFTGA